MISFTAQADDLYRRAAEIKCPDVIPPFTSCYETLFEQEDFCFEARNMEAKAREIRQQFQAIADSGFPLPESTLLRKAVVSVKKGKLMFSTEQLQRVVALVMDKLPYFLFRPKSDTKDYVILLFWANSVDDTACQIQQNLKIIQQEVAVDGFQLRFNVESVPSPKRQVLYLINNYTLVTVQNDDFCLLPPDDHKQLVLFLKLLDEQKVTVKPKKRKIVDIVGTATTSLVQ